MSKRSLIIVSFILCCFYGMAQKNVNNYKYIIVPLEFDFLKEKDKYRLNTLTRYLFKQNGFTVFFEGQELPEDLLSDKCKGLNVDIDKTKSSLFKTKLEIVLNNCYGEEIYRSRTGSSREKDYKLAYVEALRDAFVSIEELNYMYQPQSENSKNDKIKEETDYTVKEEIVESTGKESSKNNRSTSEFAYAQSINSGYQLVDAESKNLMILITTSAKDIFIVKNKNAIVYKDKSEWIYFQNNDGEITTYPMKIKF